MRKVVLVGLLVLLCVGCDRETDFLAMRKVPSQKMTAVGCEDVLPFLKSGIYQGCMPGQANCLHKALQDRNIGTDTTFDLLPLDVSLQSVIGNKTVLKSFFCRIQQNATNLKGDLDPFLAKTIPISSGSSRLVAVYEHDTSFSAAVFNLFTSNLAPQLTVTLQWGADAFDLELHLVRLGGVINNKNNPNWQPANEVFDCTWTSCIRRKSGILDWPPLASPLGDPEKDIDNVSENGIENIYLNTPEQTSYNVYVEYWANGAPAQPDVTVTYGGVQIAHQTISGFYPHQVWFVGTYDHPTRTFRPVGTVMNCAAAWNGGCLLPLH